MGTRASSIVTTLLIATLMFVLAGCGASGTSATASGDAGGTGAIAAKLVWSGKSAAKSVASAPAGVTTVRLALSRTGIATVTQDFPASSGGGTLTGIPAGSGLTLTASGLDSTGAVTYTGTVANLTVQAGVTTNAGTVTLVSVNQGAVSVQTALQSGFYSVKNDRFTPTGATTPVTIYSYELITATASLISKATTYFNTDIGAWSTTAPLGYSKTGGYTLAASGWVANPDTDPDGYGVVFNADGTATMTSPLNGSQQIVAFSSTDISNQPLSTGYPKYTEWLVSSSTATFPAGSVRYDATLTPLTDNYNLWDNHGVMTSLAGVPTSSIQVYIDSKNAGPTTNYYCTFASTGNSATIYSQTGTAAAVSIGTASWALVAVNGVQIVEVTIPANLRSQYQLGGNPIVALVGGNAWSGSHAPANQVDNGSGGSGLNATAFTFLKSQFTIGQGTVSASW